jgi:pimeloyl-ACP methyl ester carboxylesterase
MQKLVIFNSPHPGTFLRELKHSAAQQEASAYMNFLVQPDAEQHLAADDFARMWTFFTDMGNQRKADDWLTEDVKQQYRDVWSRGLRGGCNYYRASPLRPATATDPAASAVEIPASMLTITVPTLVVWGMDDTALPPALMDGLDAYVRDLTVRKVPDATHWIIHEQPKLAIRLVEDYLSRDNS